MRAQKFLKLLSIVLVLFTSGCQGRYASLNNVMNQCGFKTTAFSKFHDCMNEKLPAPQAGQQDYYAQTAQDIRNELQYCSGQIHSKKMKEKQAYEYFQGYVNTKDIEEQKSAQVAGAIVAVALVGVAVNTCANTNCMSDYGGGSSYDAPYMCSACPSCSPVCTTGKACGNTCISVLDACHVGRGTACNTHIRSYP